MKFRNLNDFFLNISLDPPNLLHSQYLSNLPIKISLGPGAIKLVDIELTAISVGKINTIINATVNDNHYVPIIFKANIVPHSLSVSHAEVIIDATEPLLGKIISLVNTLNVPVHYTWHMAQSICFDVKPKSGTVPPGRSIMNEVIFIPNYNNKISSKLAFENKYGNKQTISATVRLEKIDICMFNAKIEVLHIPLNLLHKEKAVILNRSHSHVLFTVKNPKPYPGVKIYPVQGVVPKRSYKVLNIDILIKMVLSFDCTVEVLIHNYDSVSFEIVGIVEYPNIVMKPESIRLRRIATGSMDVHYIYLENKGQAVAKIEYKNDLWQEFYISTTTKNDFCYNITEIFLEAGEKQYLCLKYFPKDISMDKFYIPFIINGILGPLTTGKNGNLLASSYLSAQEE